MTGSAAMSPTPASFSRTGKSTSLETIGRSRLSSGTPVRRTQHLGERLISAGLLKEEDLNTALQHQSKNGSRLGEVLSELGLVDEDSLLSVMGSHLGIASVRLREGLIDPEILALVPRQLSESTVSLPLLRVGQEMTVAMADPLDLAAIDDLRRASGLEIRPVLALEGSIRRLLPRCYEADFSVDAVTADMDVEAMEIDDESETIDLDLAGLQELAEGSPVINLISYAIVQAVRQGASDIHIEPTAKHTIIRFRVDGELREAMRPRKDLHNALVSRVKVMAKLDIAERRQPQDGRLHVRIERREIDLRVSTLPTVLGEKVVMRVLDRSNVTFDLNRLGLPNDQLDQYRGLLSRPHGLVLVTGPTGSGKTTTLYSSIELIKGIERNIVTVEDPVEYQLELINQVQVNHEAGMSFASALRSILRQDPDVILVGEIRDRETAETAIQAALTGHLVLSTLHTNDIVSAVTRLVDMGIEPFKIAAALAGVVAQRLVRTICPTCSKSYYPTASQLESLGYDGDKRRSFFYGAGCPQCFQTGYQGRSGLYEMFLLNSEIRQQIIQGVGIETLRQSHLKSGGSSLLGEGLRLAESGRTSLDEITRVAFTE